MFTDEIYGELSKPFDEIKWKPQMVTYGKEKKPYNRKDNDGNQTQVAGCIAFIDARSVMDRLDSAVGVANWGDSYRHVSIKDKDYRGNVVEQEGVECTLTVFGVSKTDVGMPSQSDGLKGAYSDALKRAAVKFGIGRFLYGYEIRWIPYDGRKLIGVSSEDIQTINDLGEQWQGDGWTDDFVKDVVSKVSNGRANWIEELSIQEGRTMINTLKGKLSD